MYYGAKATMQKQSGIKLIPLTRAKGISSRTASRQARRYEFFAVKLGRWLVFCKK